MAIIEALERGALIPVARVFVVVASVAAMLVLAVSGIGALSNHLEIQEIEDSSGLSSVTILQLRQALSLQDHVAPPDPPEHSPSGTTAGPSAEETAARRFAVAADPDRNLAFFAAYAAARSIADECSPYLQSTFLSELAGVAEKASSEIQSFGYARVLNVFCEQYRQNSERLVAGLQAANAELEVLRAARDTNFAVAGVSLCALSVLALALAMFSIDRSTRALGALVAKVSGTLSVLLITAAVPFVLPSPGLAQSPSIKTDAERAREAKQRRVADLKEDIEGKRRHEGKVYYYNPGGSESVYFYRSPPTKETSRYPDFPYAGDRFQFDSVQRLQVVQFVSWKCGRPLGSKQDICYGYKIKADDLSAYTIAGYLVPVARPCAQLKTAPNRRIRGRFRVS